MMKASVAISVFIGLLAIQAPAFASVVLVCNGETTSINDTSHLDKIEEILEQQITKTPIENATAILDADNSTIELTGVPFSGIYRIYEVTDTLYKFDAVFEWRGERIESRGGLNRYSGELAVGHPLLSKIEVMVVKMVCRMAERRF